MKEPLSHRRQIENEMIFRRANENVADTIETLEPNKLDRTILHFLCECSDENCIARIPLHVDTYQRIHQNRKAFVIKPGHQVADIEKVILTKKDYNVVEKDHTLPRAGKVLNDTPINNV